MGALLTILGMALLWSFLVGQVNAGNLLVGAGIGVLLLSIVQREGERPFARRAWALLRFLLSFLWQLLAANVLVALLALRPRPRYHPHVVAVPLRVTSDAAIALLSAAVTLLPGSVAMGVSGDRGLLYAHTILQADPGRARDALRRLEDLILGFMT